MRRLLALALACSLVLSFAHPALTAVAFAEAPDEAPLEQAPNVRPYTSAHYDLSGTVKYEGVTIDILGEGDIQLPDKVRGTYKFGPFTAEVVVVDNAVFTRTRFEPTWSRQTIPGELNTGAVSATDLARFSRDIRRVGVEMVGGVSTEHYTAAIDVQSLLAPIYPTVREPEAREALRSLRATYDIWVGTSDRLVRQERLLMTIQLPSIEPGGDPGMASIDLTTAYSRLNEPVSIAAPPRNDPTPIRTPRPDVIPVTGPAGAPLTGRPGAPSQAPAQLPRR